MRKEPLAPALELPQSAEPPHLQTLSGQWHARKFGQASGNAPQHGAIATGGRC